MDLCLGSVLELNCLTFTTACTDRVKLGKFTFQSITQKLKSLLLISGKSRIQEVAELIVAAQCNFLLCFYLPQTPSMSLLFYPSVTCPW